MTTHGMDSDGDPQRAMVSAADREISKEVRAEIARQKPERGLSQAQMAFELFGESQAWFNRRLNGAVAFTAAELLTLADYLGVDVVQFLNATKKGDGPLAPGHPFRKAGVMLRPTNPCLSGSSLDRKVIIGPWITPAPSVTAA